MTAQPQHYSHAYHDVCNEWMVKSVATTIMENGMQDAGYEYSALQLSLLPGQTSFTHTLPGLYSQPR